MTTSCSDVCDLVIAQLVKLGYEIEDNPDHDSILLALEECHLQRIVTLDKYLEMGIIWKDDGKYFALDANDKPDGDQEQLLMGWVGEEAELEGWLRAHPLLNTWTMKIRWSEKYPEAEAP